MSKIAGILCTGYGAYFIKKGDAMNPEQLTNQIEEAVKNRPLPKTKRYWLVFKEGRFLCLPQAPATGSDSVISELSLKDCEEGLTLNKWSKIVSKVAKLMEEKTT